MTCISSPQVLPFGHWRKSLRFGDVWLGVIPVLNSVIALNEAATLIWDMLIETNDPELTASLYQDRYPSRSEVSVADVQHCLTLWGQQGLLDITDTELPSKPSYRPEGSPPSDQMAFRKTLALGCTSVTIEIEAPILGSILADLTSEFPMADTAATTLSALGSRENWLLIKDGKGIRQANSLMLIRGLIVAEMLNTAAAALPAHAMIHGAALVRNGHGILMTGASGAGKSTLAAVMVAKGWQLAAEDCAIFDCEMRVVPMPFALSIKSGSVSTLRRFFPDLDSAQVFRLGRRLVRYQPLPPSRRATNPVKPTMIVDVRYRADLAPTEVISRPLSPLEALQLFLTEESRIDFEQDDGLAFLKFVEETPAYALEFGNAEAAEEALRNLLSGLHISCADIEPGLPVSDREAR